MTTKRIGVVFPGYGQQFIGMGKDLYDELRIVQELFEQAAGTAEFNFVKLLFASSDEEISSIRHAYLAIYLFEVSLYEVLAQKGLKPDFVAGHGIGEYAAAYATRSLSFIDGLYILNKYSQLYDEFLQDKQYDVLRITRDFDINSIEELCQKMSAHGDVAYVAASNTQHAFYVAGHAHVIEKIRQYCVEEVIRKVRVVGPAYGMHSELVDPVVANLKLYYHKIKFGPLQVPLITNVDGVYVTTSDALESAFMRKINSRIEWYETIKGFEGCDIILSVGPGTDLIEWFKEVYPDKEYRMVSTLKDIEALSDVWMTPSTAVSEQAVDVVSDKDENASAQPPKTLYEADLINEKSSDFDVEDDE